MATYKNINDGDIKAQTVHIGDNITHIINEQSLDIPVRLTNFIPVDASHVVGRDTELQTIRHIFGADKPIAFVNGMGGIGKTTLALKYIVTYTPQYQHLAWLNAAAGIQSAFIGNDALLTALHIKEDVEKYINAAQLDKAFDCVFKRLNDLATTNGAIQNHPLSKNNILVVLDNANELEDLLAYKKYFDTAHIHLLITSRALPTDWQIIKVEALPKEQALKLFRQTAPSVNAADDALFDLLDKLFYHTLLIELVAKAAKANAMDFDRLRRAINDKFIHDPDLQKRKINVAPHSETIGEEVKRAKISEYIWLIFKSVKELPQQAREMLRAFALLPPATAFDESFLTQHFAQWDIVEDIYDDLDIHLVERGWLDKDGVRYSLHPLIAEVVVEHLDVNAEYADVYIKHVAYRIDYKNINPEQNLFRSKQYEIYAERIYVLFSHSNTQSVAYLFDRLGYLNENFDIYDKALILKEKALSIANTYFEDNPEQVFNYQNNLANLYDTLGRYEEALYLFEQSINGMKKYLSENYPLLSVCQLNLSNVYQHLGRYKDAADLLEEALANDIKIYGESSTKVALDKGNLGNVYFSLGKYSEGMILSAEALVSDLQNYEKNHPEIAQKKANLGVMFYTYCTFKGTTEFLEGATELLEDALSSNMKNFGKTHISVANLQFNLAFVYQDLKRTKEAYTLLKEAYDTYLTIFGENHPNTIAVKEILDFIPPSVNTPQNHH